MHRAFAFSCVLAAFVWSLSAADVSCSESCGTMDSVALLDEYHGMFLVYRVSGLQDKMEFFEIYKGKPAFDVCGSARMSAIATEPYERSRGFLKGLEFRDGHLNIIYTHRRSASIKPADARLLH
jgi:hypothetical protein